MAPTSEPQSTAVPADAEVSAGGRSADGKKGTMSFGGHLEELRSCSIRALAGFAAATLLSLIFADRILAFILQPVLVVQKAHGQRPEIQALSPPDAFITYLKMALLCGLVIATPWVILQIWRFISLGLYKTERRFLRLFAPVSLLLFFGGVAFMFFVVLPVVLNFFVTFGERIRLPNLEPNALQRLVMSSSSPAEVEKEEPPLPVDVNVPLRSIDPTDPPPGSVWINTTRKLYCVQTDDGLLTIPMQPADQVSAVKSQFGLNFYVSFVLLLALAFGLAFELPLVVLFLTSMDIVTVDDLARSRRYVLLGVVAGAAVLTPPDVISQLLLAFPMMLLFEGALVVSRLVVRPAPAVD